MVYYLNQKRYVQKRIDMMDWLLKKQPKKIAIKKDTKMDELIKLFESVSTKHVYDIDELLIKLKI